jgi:hypothetical protein
MIWWDEGYRLLMADSIDEVRSIAHASGQRQVGMMDEDDLAVYLVLPSGEVQLTHHSDHWGVPAWYEDDEVSAD